jgi:glycosyltransferase involved in cell wall biosynthesis
MAVLVRQLESARSLERFCREHPSSRRKTRRLRIFEEQHFHDDFAAAPPARQLYFPFAIESRYAWARQRLGPGSFTLSGVTHTLCTASAVKQLCELVTAPFEPHDALICTSSAVAAMVRTVTGSFAQYLRDRHGGTPGLNIRLETIPLGVDSARFRPATAEERSAARRALVSGDHELVALFVGRFAHHAKAHPFPMFRGIDLAAKTAGRVVRLLMSGWAPNQAIQSAFVEGARAFAPAVNVTFVDGMDATARVAIWRAADLFVSLVDSIQETFGLAIVEAMASGLPVVAADWNGYRDLVQDGRTGLLVPTTMVRGASGAATSRLMFGALDYDHFLAEVSQTVVVDVGAASTALARLIGDEGLSSSLSAADAAGGNDDRADTKRELADDRARARASPGCIARFQDLHAQPALFGSIDKKQAAERPERLTAQGLRRLLVNDDHALSSVGQLGRGDQTGQAAPHDDHVRVVTQARPFAATRARRETLCRARGSSAIFRRFAQQVPREPEGHLGEFIGAK